MNGGGIVNALCWSAVASDETADSSRATKESARAAKAPGLLLVFGGNRAAHHALAVGDEPATLGRVSLARDFAVEDSRASREHITVAYSAGHWLVNDQESKNGTFVDGNRVERYRGPHPRVLRIGDSLFVFCDEIRPHLEATMERDEGVVVGPVLQRLYAEITEIALAQSVLHITGATGSGKELAARHFHRASHAKGPFVPVNCATLVPQLAERLLFGTVRGAYSGAEADAPGLFQTASGGTLFLDEVGEIPLDVQAKLLRAMETREVLPLGGQRAVRVDVRVCSATHEQLEVAVERGRFRQDLFYRLARPVVAIPELRDHLEDVPWLIERALVAEKLSAHNSLIETALLRRWPGNIRELLVELASAARAAKRDRSAIVKGSHLSAQAGLLTPKANVAEAPEPESSEATAIRAVLKKQNGNVAGTARALGMHRTQLRRALVRLGIDPNGER